MTEKLPRTAWFGALPFATLAAAGLFLRANWARIPERFPVHWTASGEANRWSERSARGVYGPLIFAGELCAVLLAMALASWFGARQSPLRRVIFGTMIAVECVMGLLFSFIAVNPVLGLPVWIIAVTPAVLVIGIVVVTVRKTWDLGEGRQAQSGEGWYLGFVYYAPADPAIFVPKRYGIGYTFNFGNKWAWLLTAALVLVMASARLLL